MIRYLSAQRAAVVTAFRCKPETMRSLSKATSGWLFVMILKIFHFEVNKEVPATLLVGVHMHIDTILLTTNTALDVGL